MRNSALVTRFAVIAALSAIPVFAAGSCWLRDAASPAPSTVYALCEQGVVWVTTDGGVKWTARPVKSDLPVRAMAFLDANRGIVVGDSGLVLGSEDGGKSWTPQKSGTKEKLMDVTFVGNEGWATGMNGTLIHSTDGGRNWTPQKTSTTQALEGIFFVDAKHGWAVGWAGTILRTVDGGATWQSIKANDAQWSMSAMYFKDEKVGWAVGFAGQILGTTDGGLTWKLVPSPTKAYLTTIAFDKEGHGWIAYDDGFLTSTDGGATWKAVSANGRFFLARLFRMNDDLWALGQSVMLRHMGGTEWKRIDSLVPNTTMQGAAIDSTPSK
jgi:photosystem II stability/assembly factor-like uncharacterized protein